jgi:tripartite-type tricarboxylate transporter receptor subunit TctC
MPIPNALTVARSAAACTVAMALAVPAAALAQTQRYPVKPIRIIVPLAPAGTTDLVARIVAQKLSEAFGQPVIVDNRTGGGTTIGSALVARAQPDGYTLLYHGISLATTVPLYSKLSYDPARDFAPVAQVGQSFYVVAVHPSVPVQTIHDLIAMARAKPKQVSYASAGLGTITHLTVELFQANAKIQMLHVPFKGGAPAIVALVGGQVQAIFNPIAEILPHVRTGGRVRTLAVTAPKRAPDLPDVPTLAESGFPGATVQTFSGLFAPAGTPRVIIDRLNTEVNSLLKLAEIQERFQYNGLVPLGGTPVALGDALKFEIARWSKVVKDAGITID